ncbi:MAG: hypothetical protein J0L62_05855 [Bacteroidetes bacterium]|nr:hypothetical protein [Bacteroidota bacterium]
MPFRRFPSLAYDYVSYRNPETLHATSLPQKRWILTDIALVIGADGKNGGKRLTSTTHY